MPLVFEWDHRKAGTNLRKHRVGFAEAVSVFSDPLARIFADKDHSSEEPREIIIGHSSAKRLLLVCFTEPVRDQIRILSARRATSESGTIMKNMSQARTKTKRPDGLLPEYRFDYSKAKLNRFAERTRPGSVAVVLDPDVARVFKDGESVNAVLRALMTTMPVRRTPASS